MSVNGNIRTLYDKDVLQHIQTIYDILGIKDISEINDETIVDKINDMKGKLMANGVWCGSQQQHDEDWGNGTITPDMLCIII